LYPFNSYIPPKKPTPLSTAPPRVEWACSRMREMTFAFSAISTPA